MYQALKLRNPDTTLPGERTVYRIMAAISLIHKSKRKPYGITKVDRNARKSEDLLSRNFQAYKPLIKAVTDIIEIKCKGRKLYVSAIFNCFDLTVLGLTMDSNMKASLCARTVDNAMKASPTKKSNSLQQR